MISNPPAVFMITTNAVSENNYRVKFEHKLSAGDDHSITINAINLSHTIALILPKHQFASQTLILGKNRNNTLPVLFYFNSKFFQNDEVP